MTISVLPDDRFNRELVGHTHPAGWQNPEPRGPYNLVVIGGGSAGLVSAMGAAGLGARVALVEKHLLGGDCLNFGCVPSKGLLAAAHAAHAVEQAAQFGVTVTGRNIDFGRAMRWVRESRASIAPHDSAARVKSAGVDVFLGEGRFIDRTSVEVDGARLEFKKAVIATGARAAAPPIPGLDSVDYLTNETLFSLTERPDHLLILGAGPIGCEMAQAFRRLGARVTLLDMADRVLPRDDARASDIIGKQLESEGVALCLGVKIERVENAGDAIAVRILADGEQTQLTGSHLLIAAGRRPNVKGMGLDRAGVEYDEARGVVVNPRLQTANSRIYAAGDVASRYQFTHAADAMARIVLRNAFFFGRGRVDQLVIPWATFTDPEVAHVGLSAEEAEARSAGCVEVALADMDRAIVQGQTQGFARAFYDEKGRVLGATVVAPNAGDLIGELSLLMTHRLSLAQLANTIHPYPTQSEILKRLGDGYMRTRLSPTVASLFQRWFRWLL